MRRREQRRPGVGTEAAHEDRAKSLDIKVLPDRVQRVRRVAPVTVAVLRGGRWGLVDGPVRVVHPAIRALGCAWRYDAARHVYEVPAAVIDEVAAAIVSSGHAVVGEVASW